MQLLPFAVRATVFCLGLVVLASSSRADTVYLKNGAYIDGLVTARNSKLLTITIGEIGKIDVELDDVVRVEKNSRTGSHLTKPVDLRELPDVVRAKNKDSDEGEDEDDDYDDYDDDDYDDDDYDDYDDDDDDYDDDEASDSEIDPELKAEIEGHVKDLQRQKTRYRRRAERKLEKIGAPIVPFLIPLVTRGGDLTRITALRLIFTHAKERDPELVEACLKALKDANYFVRDYAAKTLRRVANQDFEFDAKAQARSRRRAASKWQRWWEKAQATDNEAAADADSDDDGKKKKKRKKEKKRRKK